MPQLVGCTTCLNLHSSGSVGLRIHGIVTTGTVLPVLGMQHPRGARHSTHSGTRCGRCTRCTQCGRLVARGHGLFVGRVRIVGATRLRPAALVFHLEGQLIDTPAGHVVLGGHFVDRTAGPSASRHPPLQRLDEDVVTCLLVDDLWGTPQHEHHLAADPPAAHSTAPSNEPRQTSSWSLVSSRATATGRSPPQTAARSPRVAPVRPGDSKRTEVRCSPAIAANRSARSRPERGRNPSKQNRSVAKPLETSAASTADGPGITVTVSPALATAAATRDPGSETAGMPASLTSATVRPATTAATTSSIRSTSLCSWRERVSTPVIPEWLRSFRECRVSSQ